MENIRVHELAKMYGITNEQLIDFLIRNDITVDNQMSQIDIVQTKKIIEKLEGKKNLYEHRNRTGLQRIVVEGLFDKYDYEIEFKDDIRILVAENGIGKTTILSIIVSLLTGDKKALSGIKFKKIELTIADEVFIIDKYELQEKTMDEHKVDRLLDELQMVLPASQIMRIKDRYRATRHINIDEIEEIIRHYSYRNMERDKDRYIYYKRIDHILSDFREFQFYDFADKLFEIKSRLNEELLFYPTYRRIEVSMNKLFSNGIEKSYNELSKHARFGMDDVKSRINGLMRKMSEDANNSYLEMNGSIISDLLKGVSVQELAKKIPSIDRHKVEVIIKRIGEGRIENIDKLKEFVSGNRENPNEDFLKFYLDRLVKIYDGQKAIDEKLSKFAEVCSKYLLNKKIIYDEAMLSMDIYDEYHNSIDLDSLSSGEKQIISIFSKVYLDITTSCICIIDEPEISLSIEWQKEFLQDIYNSGKVGLLIATTHSPFIFKNSFRDYTVELDMYRKGY